MAIKSYTFNELFELVTKWGDDDDPALLNNTQLILRVVTPEVVVGRYLSPGDYYGWRQCRLGTCIISQKMHRANKFHTQRPRLPPP